jgi:hypothetical protein
MAEDPEDDKIVWTFEASGAARSAYNKGNNIANCRLYNKNS